MTTSQSSRIAYPPTADVPHVRHGRNDLHDEQKNQKDAESERGRSIYASESFGEETSHGEERREERHGDKTNEDVQHDFAERESVIGSADSRHKRRDDALQLTISKRLYKENRRQESNKNSIQQHDHQEILQRRMIAASNIADKHFAVFPEPDPSRKALNNQIQHDCD